MIWRSTEYLLCALPNTVDKISVYWGFTACQALSIALDELCRCLVLCNPVIRVHDNTLDSIGNWGPNRLSNLLKFTQPASVRLGFQPRQSDSTAVRLLLSTLLNYIILKEKTNTFKATGEQLSTHYVLQLSDTLEAEKDALFSVLVSSS